MSSIVRDFIEYSGISDNLPLNASAFKQLSIQEKLCISPENPEIDQTVKVVGDISIMSTRVIKTPIGTSFEGQTLTGWKLLVEGELNQKIEYIADMPAKPVHAEQFYIPFSTFIVLPEYFKVGTPIVVTGHIEDMFIEELTKKVLFNSVTILIDAEFC